MVWIADKLDKIISNGLMKYTFDSENETLNFEKPVALI